MQYKFAKEQQDYSDFSSGRVFYGLPGHPAFPVRLGSEIFQRCIACRKAIHGNAAPCTLYDPCCGAAYHVSVLAYLHGESIREVIVSDIDKKAVELARRNLGLLYMDGLDRRIEEILALFEQYGKDSHKEALTSAQRLKEKLSMLRENHQLETKAFQSSATDHAEILKNIQPRSIDIVLTDVPYGLHSYWQDAHQKELSDPMGAMLDALLNVLSPSSLLAIASDKRQRVSHERFQRLEQFQIGKRRVVILKPIT